jgi:glycosyltransferase 2 family protein
MYFVLLFLRKIFALKSTRSQKIQYIILLALGIFLSYFFFKNLNFDELKHNIEGGNFSWFYVVMLVTLLVYIIRAWRWQMLIKSMKQEAAWVDCFSALSIGYFVNFAVPRLGEISRCLTLKKQNNAPFSNLLGTVIIERVVDIISLALVIVLTFILQYNQIASFTQQNLISPIYNSFQNKFNNGSLLFYLLFFVGMLMLFFVFYFFRKKIKNKTPAVVLKIANGFADGIISIRGLENKWLFLFQTILIWIGYLLMTYFWFYVFPQTALLTVGASLTILSIGSIGRSVPIQGGGMGAYHFLVTQVALIYGLNESFGKTLATLIHAGQTLFTFVLGIVGLIIFFVRSSKKLNND